MEIQKKAVAAEPRPKGAILIVGIVGLLTLALWGALFALAVTRV
ncbi:MAG TPA: hypothetical protein VFN77_05400 [Acetobacteraceae bacterium]|nr:hypothetical protein [Acetobacteraceae bacterium]